MRDTEDPQEPPRLVIGYDAWWVYVLVNDVWHTLPRRP